MFWPTPFLLHAPERGGLGVLTGGQEHRKTVFVYDFVFGIQIVGGYNLWKGNACMASENSHNLVSLPCRFATWLVSILYCDGIVSSGHQLRCHQATALHRCANDSLFYAPSV